MRRPEFYWQAAKAKAMRKLEVGDDVETPEGDGYILDKFDDNSFEVQLTDGRTKTFRLVEGSLVI